MTAIDAASTTALAADLAALHAGAARWATLPVAEKIALLHALRVRTAAAADRWTATAAAAKGIAGTPLAGEEAMSGSWALIRALGCYSATLAEIERFGAPQFAPDAFARRADGQVVLRVFPRDAYDRLLLGGIHADVWMQPGIAPDDIRATAGRWYRETSPQPRVALVLGAGNIASIAPLDVLYKMLAEGAVCMLKLNPVNAYLEPIFAEIFAPLIDADFVRIVSGGAELGALLCTHPLVDEIHITGSERTHDRIVFGDGDDADIRKAQNRPLLLKPITSELGNVSPTIVVPGRWSHADIAFQAEHIATQKLHNDGFNCIAAQVLILPADWSQTPPLIAALEDVFRRLADRPAYYPGARERVRQFAAQASHSAGGTDPDSAPRVILHLEPDVDATLLETEIFGSVLGIVTLPGDPGAYLTRAVAFANARLRGSLGANLIVDPVTAQRNAAQLDRAIADLRYGCIGVNAWSGVGFLLVETPWGAYPGNSLAAVGSGIGVVHNSHLLERTQKSVVYAPFAPFPRGVLRWDRALLPKPPWFVTHARAARIGAELTHFEMHKTPLGLARIATLALMG